MNEDVEYYIWDYCPQELLGKVSQLETGREEDGHNGSDVTGIATGPMTPIEHPSVGRVRMGAQEGSYWIEQGQCEGSRAQDLMQALKRRCGKWTLIFMTKYFVTIL